MAECYICYSGEGELLVDVCECKTMQLHFACQIRTGLAVCTICKTPYSNVRQRKRIRIHTPDAYILGTIYVVIVLCITTAIMELLWYIEYGISNLLVMHGVFIVFAACSMSVGVYIKARYRLCFFSPTTYLVRWTPPPSG